MNFSTPPFLFLNVDCFLARYFDEDWLDSFDVVYNIDMGGGGPEIFAKMEKSKGTKIA